jgi:16S rRNA (adenine1518-N6/adenine1519-N6)-dimethyltransferase
MPEGVSARVLERVARPPSASAARCASLKGVPGALEALEALGIDPARRAETLSVEDFVAIARRLSA